MMNLYDHIQELRAELRHCRLTRRERAETKRALALAIAQQAALDRLSGQIRDSENRHPDSPLHRP